MEYRTIEKAGLRISRLAMGTWTFAGGEMWGAVERQECMSAVKAALDAGITIFDTAPTYGDGTAEEILGEALKGKGDEVIVATKVRVEGEDEAGIRGLVENSLRRLKRDSIDLLQIHWPASDPVINGRALEIMGRLKDEGLAQNIGVCNFGLLDLEENPEADLVSNQLPYNLMWRAIEDSIVPATRSRGMALIGYSTLLHGLLSGKYTHIDQFPDGRARTRHFGPKRPQIRHSEQGTEEETQKLLDSFLGVAQKTGILPVMLAVGFALARPFLDSVLIGARNADQIRAVTGVFDNFPGSEVLGYLEKESLALKSSLGANPDLYKTESRIRYW